VPAPLLPDDHPHRRALAAEAHARPAAVVSAPAFVSCLALLDADVGVVMRMLAELAVRHGGEAPEADAPHAIVELGGGRVWFERHGEFITLVVVRLVPGTSLERLDAFQSAFELLPEGWLAALPGRVIAASDVAVLPLGTPETAFEQARRFFVAETTAASRVLDGSAWVLTDFVLRPDGRTRFMVLDVKLGRAQTGRLVQRLLEIEVYRMMAMLAFPVARALFTELRPLEEALARVTAAMAEPRSEQAERELLEELAGIAMKTERGVTATMFRCSAALAYWEIVKARVSELREQRSGDLRTLNGFLSRRLAPAMNTVQAAARRQEQLSDRLERATALLRTRVDIKREEQNLRVLSSMERRSAIQLRLQETVEGLSVAAITYYVVSLVHHALEPFEHVLPVHADVVAAVSIPFVALLLWRGLHRVRAPLKED
jgi:uncharacterized membrane-anchored protein